MRPARLLLLLAPFLAACPRTKLPLAPAASLDFRSLHRDALLASAVYQDVPAARAALGDPAARVEFVDLPGVECRYFLAVSTTVPAQVLGLRGTSNLKNALLDVQITDELDTDLSMRLHRGFAVSSLAVLADVRPRLDKARPVRLVGHSLGGAQAVILGLWLQKEGFIVERVVTFGQPQLTNARGGGKAAGLPLLRVVNDRDLVPFMPPAEIVPFLKSYRPFGPEVVLLEGPSYYRPVSRAPDLPRLRAFVDALQAGGTPPEIQEHGIAVYAFRLSTKADAAQEVPAP